MSKSGQTPKPKFNNKHTDDLVDHYWGTIGYLNALIKASELKAGILLSFYSLLFNLIYNMYGELLISFTTVNLLSVLSILWAIVTSLSIFFCVRCFIPRLEKNYEENMFFFKDAISKFGDDKSFAKLFFETSTNEEALFDQLGRQVYINSKIANWKFNNVTYAIRFLALGFIILFLFGLSYFLL